jgi:4-amino-4-deoxy-L-arabinose transferase-like glycosyltransferase
MDIILAATLAILTFLSRVVNLTGVPIFTDEAIYIRWAQIGLVDPAQRFISLTDGKQPLLTWCMYPFLTIMKDPLIAGRIVSVLTGVGTSVALYLLARELFGRKAAIATVILYILCPFSYVYDRLALMDSMVGLWTVVALYLEVLLIRKPKLDRALLLGIAIGLGLLTKSSALFSLLLLPVSWLLIVGLEKIRVKRVIRWIGFSAVSGFIAEAMYNMLRLSPWFYIIKQKNYSFIMTFSEFMQKPFSLFLPNLNGLSQWVFGYLTLPIVIIIVAGVLFGFLRRDRRILLLLLWFLFPFLSLGAFGIVLFPRFTFFMVLPLMVIAGWVVSQWMEFARTKLPLLIFVPIVFLLYPGYQVYLLATRPVAASIPETDRNQLFNDWPSGYGVREVVQYLQSEASITKIVVGTEGTFGLNPAVYEMYLGKNPNIEIHGYWPVGQVPEELLISAETKPTYLIFKESQNIPSSWPLTLIQAYRRGNGSTFLYFYQVNPTHRNGVGI